MVMLKHMPTSIKGKPIKNKLSHHLGNSSGKTLASENQRQCAIGSRYKQASDYLALTPILMKAPKL